jgi:hypothetical protein
VAHLDQQFGGADRLVEPHAQPLAAGPDDLALRVIPRRPVSSPVSRTFIRVSFRNCFTLSPAAAISMNIATPLLGSWTA